MSEPIILTTQETLRRIVAEELRKALHEHAPEAPPNDWMDADQAAAFLGYSRQYLPQVVRDRGIPHHRVGRRLRFRRSELEDWIDATAQ